MPMPPPSVLGLMGLGMQAQADLAPLLDVLEAMARKLDAMEALVEELTARVMGDGR